jgi:ABC-type lipoprotein release transport system permease subunit
MLLSAVGLYGLISQSVAAQMREIGIRMTLGAAPVALQRGVRMRSARLAAIGVSAGVLVVMTGAERLIGSIVFGVSPTDAITLAGAAVILLGTSLLASYIPARRAGRVDPVTVLRTE